MKALARIISFVTNPIFILFPMPYLLLHRLGYNHQSALKWTAFSLIFFLITGIFVFYEVKHKMFSDMDVSRKEQRQLLFLIMSAIAFVYLISLSILNAPFILFIIVWGAMAGILATSLVSLQVKASIHIEALTIVLITPVKLYNLSYLLFLLIPVIAWSRITIHRHSLLEVITGFTLGIALTVTMYILLLYTLPL